jgi:general secretion pathway protein A
VRLRFHLTALTKAETTAYIDHRLEVAGSQGRRIFAEDTYATIYKYTGGVPRLINTLCDTCMMAAFGKDQDTVTAWRISKPPLASCSGSSRGRHQPHALPTIWSSTLRPQPETATTVGTNPDGQRRQDRRGARTETGRLVIGRTPDNDLQIDSKFISRHHCQIVTQHDSCLIEDLNSTNGIFVQSKRVRRHNLNDGDVVQVGQHEIMYIDERTPRVRNAFKANAYPHGWDHPTRLSSLFRLALPQGATAMSCASLRHAVDRFSACYA